MEAGEGIERDGLKGSIMNGHKNIHKSGDILCFHIVKTPSKILKTTKVDPTSFICIQSDTASVPQSTKNNYTQIRFLHYHRHCIALYLPTYIHNYTHQ